MSDSLDLASSQVAQLVQTPRTLDKSWTRLLRGDRGCAFDAMSLVGAVCTIISFSLAQMEVWPWFPGYISAGTWVLGFAMGTRAQLRSGRQRRLALTEGPLVSVGIVEAEASLLEGGGGKGRVGRALVTLRKLDASDPSVVRDAQAASEVALRIKRGLDAGKIKSPEITALIGDRFSFARVSLPEPELQDWLITRVILQTDRLGKDAGPLHIGASVWAIYHEETDFLEQAMLSAS